MAWHARGERGSHRCLRRGTHRLLALRAPDRPDRHPANQAGPAGAHRDHPDRPVRRSPSYRADQEPPAGTPVPDRNSMEGLARTCDQQVALPAVPKPVSPVAGNAARLQPRERGSVEDDATDHLAPRRTHADDGGDAPVEFDPARVATRVVDAPVHEPRDPAGRAAGAADGVRHRPVSGAKHAVPVNRANRHDRGGNRLVRAGKTADGDERTDEQRSPATTPPASGHTSSVRGTRARRQRILQASPGFTLASRRVT
jgi:hypothetical protein